MIKSWGRRTRFRSPIAGQRHKTAFPTTIKRASSKSALGDPGTSQKNHRSDTKNRRSTHFAGTISRGEETLEKVGSGRIKSRAYQVS